MGVASKDASRTRIEDTEIRDIEQIAIMAYTKKAEYGPSHVTTTGVKIERASHDHLAQTGSSIEVDGKPVEPRDLDVDKLYKNGRMKNGRFIILLV